MDLSDCSFAFLPFSEPSGAFGFPDWDSSPQRVRICMFKKKRHLADRLKIQQTHQCSQSCYQWRSTCITVTHEGIQVSMWASCPPLPIPKPVTPRHQPPSVLSCHLAGALRTMSHQGLQAQSSGQVARMHAIAQSKEIKHHLLCKHLFQARPAWLSGSSVHFLIE